MMTEIYHKEHLLDRAAMLAMRGLIALQPAADLSPRGRPEFDDLMGRTPQADGVSYEGAEVGGVPGWWCRPAEAAPGAAILYLHGGAYVVGSAQAYRNFVGQIALRAHVAAFVPDYGLAPERPFPAAVDDANAVYHGLAAAGISRIALVGASAGGGLALVTATRVSAAAREGSAQRPNAAVAMSPLTDLALTGDSMTTCADHDPLLTHAALEQGRNTYLGESDPRDPTASPLYGDLAGLPPVMLRVGEDEILLDDARRMADRVAAAGSPIELHVWQDMVHVFGANLALLRAASEALDIVAAFLRPHMHEERDTSRTHPRHRGRAESESVARLTQTIHSKV
jgi:acetyl esterase/lipase